MKEDEDKKEEEEKKEMEEKQEDKKEEEKKEAGQQEEEHGHGLAAWRSLSLEVGVLSACWTRQAPYQQAPAQGVVIRNSSCY